VRWLIILTLALLVATCGQKGPLYLPKDAGIDMRVHHA